MALKVLFMLQAHTQSFPSRVLSPQWPGITTNDQAARCVRVCVTVSVFVCVCVLRQLQT